MKHYWIFLEYNLQKLKKQITLSRRSLPNFYYEIITCHDQSNRLSRSACQRKKQKVYLFNYNTQLFHLF